MRTITQQRRIKEVIVVEGHHDTQAVQRAVAADTIETRGSSVGPEVIAEVKRARATRGVIILTDPDAAGERIRRILSREVPGCKQAFVHRDQARGPDGVGVEHAPPEEIRRALDDARYQVEESGPGDITWERYMDAGLVGGKDARERRAALARNLGIGYGNARQFFRRLHLLRVSEKEFKESLERIGRDETDG